MHHATLVITDLKQKEPLAAVEDAVRRLLRHHVRFDWWTWGGRYDGLLVGKCKDAANVTTIKNLGSFDPGEVIKKAAPDPQRYGATSPCKNSENIQFVRDVDLTKVPLDIVILPDGSIHELSEMGAQWETFKSTLPEFDDQVAVLVDVHE